MIKITRTQKDEMVKAGILLSPSVGKTHMVKSGYTTGFSGDFDLSVYKGIRTRNVTVSEKTKSLKSPDSNGSLATFFVCNNGYRVRG